VNKSITNGLILDDLNLRELKLAYHFRQRAVKYLSRNIGAIGR
jgi:hypothetical protein